MSKGENKRQAIFDVYKNNLNVLVDNGLVDSIKDQYICPMCLRPHKDINSDDPLTLEDAPPKSLGGSANTLTCKSCNNTAGHKIDFHLTQRLREIDNSTFIPGTETAVKVHIDGETFQGKITVAENGQITMEHSLKNNNPAKLDMAMSKVKSGKKIDMDFLNSKVISQNLEYALLKTGYLMMFERFGYSLLLNSCFDFVRQQLKNPNERIYPEGFWFTPPYHKSMTGVYFICNPGLECLMAIFNLDTGNSEKVFGTFLPLPINSISNVITNLNKKLNDNNSKITLTLYPLEQDNSVYLTDVPNIKAMYDWIDQRKTIDNNE